MKQQKLRGVITAAVIAAAYAALSLALAPLSFGQIQIRAAEAFTLLPIYSPYAVWGVTLGCAITNAAGVATGANFLGIIDVFAGTAASLVSALLTARLGSSRLHGLPIAASLPPVFINALVIGAEWCYVTTGQILTPAFFLYFGLIAAGQFAACSGLGLLLISALERTGLHRLLTRLP